MTGIGRSICRGLNSASSDLYQYTLKRIRNTGIPRSLIVLLFGAYALTAAFMYQEGMVNWCFYKILNPDSPGWVVVTLGIAKSREDVTHLIDRVLIYPRVSSPGQEEGTSLEEQNNTLREEAEAVVDKDDIFIIGNEWESARTMLRENIDEIVAQVRNSEERYCLMFRNVDRLTRADPFEAATFCWIMKQNGVILYFSDIGYLDFSDLMQETILMMQFVQARQEYMKIKNRGSEGRKQLKQQGAYPAKPPFGYDKDDDDSLIRNDIEAEIIQRGAALAIEGDEELGVEPGNVSDVHDQLENEYDEEDMPAYKTLLDSFRREIYTGKLKHNGEVVAECPKILSEETFSKLQDTIGERTSEADDHELDHALKQVIDWFGVDAALDLFEEIIKGKCPKCGGDVKPWGTTERMGHKVKKYRCVNHPGSGDNEEGDTADDNIEACDFEGPLLSSKFLREWESSVPLICPACQLPLDDEKWETSVTKLGYIEQTCDYCDTGIAVDLSQDKFERMKEIPEGIHFFDCISRDRDHAEGRVSGDPDDDSDIASETNQSLDEYA